VGDGGYLYLLVTLASGFRAIRTRLHLFSVDPPLRYYNTQVPTCTISRRLFYTVSVNIDYHTRTILVRVIIFNIDDVFVTRRTR
jgi:hypothetical protein